MDAGREGRGKREGGREREGVREGKSEERREGIREGESERVGWMNGGRGEDRERRREVRDVMDGKGR